MNNYGYTVLIADSDIELAKDLEKRLLKEVFRVFFVDSTRKVLECVRKRKINIALIDVNLKPENCDRK